MLLSLVELGARRLGELTAEERARLSDAGARCRRAAMTGPRAWPAPSRSSARRSRSRPTSAGSSSPGSRSAPRAPRPVSGRLRRLPACSGWRCVRPPALSGPIASSECHERDRDPRPGGGPCPTPSGRPPPVRLVRRASATTSATAALVPRDGPLGRNSVSAALSAASERRRPAPPLVGGPGGRARAPSWALVPFEDERFGLLLSSGADGAAAYGGGDEADANCWLNILQLRRWSS